MDTDTPEKIKTVRSLEQEITPSTNKEFINLTPWSRRGKQMSFLPVQSTPPSSMFKIKNPFEKVLIERLHLPICSPSVFSTKTTSSKDSEEFEWTIEDISELQPANIEPSDSENIQPLDPITESMAQKAIDLFFKKHKIVPSPMEAVKRQQLPLEDGGVFNLNKKSDSFAQTELTLPPELPEDVENVLKPFFTFKGNQQQKILASTIDHEARDASLRRKLFCLEESVESICDISMDYSVLSPAPKSPVVFVSEIKNYGTPTVVNNVQNNYNDINSPNLSPISISKTKKDKFVDDYSNNSNNSPLCQSTPEKRAIQRLKTSISNIHNTPEIFQSKRVLNHCSPGYSNMSYSDQSKSTTNFNMSIDMETSVKSNRNTTLEKYNETMQYQSFTEDLDKDTAECGLYTTLISPVKTPRSSRNVNAKNLSFSFSLSEYMQDQDAGGPHTKTDSGFTETFNNVSENISTNNKFSIFNKNGENKKFSKTDYVFNKQ